MLKLEIERRKWGEYFFSPPPPPFPSFTLAPTLRVTIFTLSSSSSITISKTAVTTVRTQKSSFRPPKIRLHCRLIFLPLSIPWKVMLFPKYGKILLVKSGIRKIFAVETEIASFGIHNSIGGPLSRNQECTVCLGLPYILCEVVFHILNTSIIIQFIGHLQLNLLRFFSFVLYLILSYTLAIAFELPRSSIRHQRFNQLSLSYQYVNVPPYKR